MSQQIFWGSFRGALPDDYDLIDAIIEPNAVDAATVEFVLESGDDVRWWKGLLVPDGLGSSWELWTKDSRKSDRISLWAHQVLNGQSLEFRKAKAIAWPTGVYLLGNLDILTPGSRVTFRWVQDSRPDNSGGVYPKVINAPKWMRPGEKYDVAINVDNLSENTWSTQRRYRLGSYNPRDNFTWGINRVELPTNRISFLGVAQFRFQVTAPAQSGQYSFQWQMVQDGVEWFGPPTEHVLVHVQANEPAPVVEPPRETVTVPAVVGLTLWDGWERLSDARLKLTHVVGDPNPFLSSKLKLITHQTPDAGEQVEPNSEVLVRVTVNAQGGGPQGGPQIPQVSGLTFVNYTNERYGIWSVMQNVDSAELEEVLMPGVGSTESIPIQPGRIVTIIVEPNEDPTTLLTNFKWMRTFLGNAAAPHPVVAIT